MNKAKIILFITFLAPIWSIAQVEKKYLKHLMNLMRTHHTNEHAEKLPAGDMKEKEIAKLQRVFNLWEPLKKISFDI